MQQFKKQSNQFPQNLLKGPDYKPDPVFEHYML